MSRDLSWGANCDVCDVRMNAGMAQIAAERARDDRLLCGACSDEERLTNERDDYRQTLEALVEAVEKFFNGEVAPVWPRLTEARRLLDG